jgi:hypothetical protein
VDAVALRAKTPKVAAVVAKSRHTNLSIQFPVSTLFQSKALKTFMEQKALPIRQ